MVEAHERYISEGSAEEKAAIDGHIAAIERVHLVPASIAPVAVRTGETGPEHSTVSIPGKHDTKISSPDGAIVVEEIVLCPQMLEDFNSTTHEIGHSLDLNALGGRLSATDKLTDHWFSAQPETQEWRRAVQRSVAFDRLSTARIDMEKQAYYLLPVELWARSYEQWIATRSGDRDLREKIERRRADVPGLYWEEGEFGPVGEALEALFVTRGLVK
ncbi:MAG: hypothetical protein JJE35_03910 [Thermoleophilia bacterium]|nr:hypothetical protein [Thermoleophilia bacterium]